MALPNITLQFCLPDNRSFPGSCGISSLIIKTESFRHEIFSNEHTSIECSLQSIKSMKIWARIFPFHEDKNSSYSIIRTREGERSKVFFIKLPDFEPFETYQIRIANEHHTLIGTFTKKASRAAVNEECRDRIAAGSSYQPSQTLGEFKALIKEIKLEREVLKKRLNETELWKMKAKSDWWIANAYGRDEQKQIETTQTLLRIKKIVKA